MARRITVWGSPCDILDSEFGTIPYNEWCKLEAERINSLVWLDAPAKVIAKDNGFVAIERKDLKELEEKQ